MENIRAEKIDFLFYLNRRRPNPQGECPITLRLSADDTTATMSVNQKIHPDCWVDGYPVGKSEHVKSVKLELDTLRVKLTDTYRRLSATQSPTAEAVRDAYLGKNQPKNTRSIASLLSDVVENYRKLKEADYVAQSTLTKWSGTLMRLKEYIQWQYHTEDLPLHRIDQAFVSRFELYLKVHTPSAHNHVMKHLERVKSITDNAFHNRWIEVDPYWKYSLKLEPVERTYLDEDELKRWVNVKLSDPLLVQARDIFFFSCLTGLAYAEARNLCREDLEQDNEQTWWIRIKRQKTGNRSHIPLLPVALNILKSYNPGLFELPLTQKLLPVPSGQSINNSVRKIAELCNIGKYLTFHLARHTFASTVASANDMPLESISYIMGHRSLAITQHYAKTQDKKVSRDMGKLTEAIAKSQAYQWKAVS